MYRYFISYEDLIENNKLNEFIDIGNPRLNIIKKTKKGLYKFEPLLYVRERKNDILNYTRRINYNKKSVLMVELTENETKLFDQLFIKKYSLYDNNEYKKVMINQEDNIHLVNYNALINMNTSEINKGNIVAMMPCISNPEYMYLSGDRSVISKNSINERRNELKKMNISCDIYLHTEDENMLENYKDDITEIKEVKFHTYEVIKHKFYVIDSIKNNDVIGFNNSNFYCLDMLLSNSIPIYIIDDENGYKFTIKENYYYKSKGYIIDNINFERMIRNDSIDPLIKFINVYELEDGIYKKTPLLDYMRKDNFKYLKKTKYE